MTFFSVCFVAFSLSFYANKDIKIKKMISCVFMEPLNITLITLYYSYFSPHRHNLQLQLSALLIVTPTATTINISVTT